jgi:hypothetical protein
MKKSYTKENPKVIKEKENTFRPNKETLEAIEEARRISNQDGTGYKSFEEMIKDVLYT